MDEQEKGRPKGRPKNQSDQKSTTAERQGQAQGLPRPDAIKRAIDPAEFYRREIKHPPDFKPQADGWTQNFPCCFHEDANGSFGVNLKTGGFRCFGCGAQGGSVLDFIMLRDGLDLDGARAYLAETYGVKPGASPAGPRAERPAPAPTGAAPKPAPAPLLPIPDEALAIRPKTHPKNGTPSAVWAYRGPDGRPLFFVCRFDPKSGRKLFAPLTWTPAAGWQWKAPPEPRPLYHLDQLAARPAAPVLFAEGEKAADAAAVLFPDAATTTTMNGAQSPSKSDFRPLAGRRVRIWPDHDEPGAEYARWVAALALAAGAVAVGVLDLSCLRGAE